jgi:hypothetical protein
MRTFDKPTRNEMTDILRRTITSIRKGLVRDFDDIALVVELIRVPAIFGEDDVLAASLIYYASAFLNTDDKREMDELPTRKQFLVRFLRTGDGFHDYENAVEKTSAIDPQVLSCQSTRDRMITSLRNGISAIRSGLVRDFADCGLIANEFVRTAIFDDQSSVKALKTVAKIAKSRSGRDPDVDVQKKSLLDAILGNEKAVFEFC